MTFNPVAILQERQCTLIYNDLDCGRNANAVQQCDNLLKQQPNLHLASSLKSLALCRLNRRKEANSVVDKLLKLKAESFNNSILSPLCMALQSLDRDHDEADLLDTYSKAQTNQSEWGKKACLAMIRTYQWQRVQQTALRIHKSLSSKKDSDDLYFWWSMQAYCLIADDSSLPGFQLALTLAHRMISKQLESIPFGSNSDETVYLYARILQKEGEKNWPEALKLLAEDELGKSLCERSMTLAALRFDLRKSAGQWDVINAESIKALEDGLRNWQAVEAAIESALALSEKTSKSSAIIFVEEKLMKLARQGKRDRTVRLAPLLLLKMATEKEMQLHLKAVNLVQLVVAYYDDFKGKACASEDLEPYLSLATEQERQTLLQKLIEEQKVSSSSGDTINSLDGLYAELNNAKLQRVLQSTTEITVESETELALHYAEQYVRSLPLSKDLPKTEMQPGDDFALLTVQTLINASTLQRKSGKEGWLTTLTIAIATLKAVLKHSPKAYKLRILLVRVLQQFGCIDEARIHFDCLGIKAVQFDTLGWILAHRFTHSTLLLPPSSEEERLWLSNMRQMRTVWYEGKHQVPDMVCKAMEHGTFSRVEEMILFGDKLTNSICRRLHTVEAIRAKLMDINFAVDDSILKRELNEIRLGKEKEYYDQRDKQVISNLLPPQVENIVSQTEPVTQAPEPSLSYVRAMTNVLSGSSFSSGVENVDSVENSIDESGVSLDEMALCRISNALKGKEDKSAIILDQFKMILERCKTNTNATKEVPNATLHSACVALEAFYLIKSDDKSSEIQTKAKDYLVQIGDILKQFKPNAPSNDLSSQWANIFDKILSMDANSDGDAKSATFLKEVLDNLSNGTKIAFDSLFKRIEAVL